MQRTGASGVQRNTLDPGWLNDRFTFFPEPAPNIDPTVWKSVFEGLRDSRTLKFNYLNPGYQRAYARAVRPYHAISFKAEWYLLGHCEYMKSLRIFAMSRISKVKVTDDYFFIPDDFDFKTLAGSHFGIMFGKEEYRVRILFNRSAAPYARERQWHPTQEVEDQDDGSIILSFTTNHLFEVKRWVLSWGSDAQVLAPPELVEQVKAELAESLAGYE